MLRLFLNGLKAPERPPHLYVCLDLRAESLDEETVRAVAAEHTPLSNLGLQLELRHHQVNAFLEALVGAAEAPKFGGLKLSLDWCPLAESGHSDEEEINEGLSLMGEAIQMGRLSSLQKIRLVNDFGGNGWEDSDVGETVREGKEAFLAALSRVKLPFLSDLAFVRFILTDADLAMLAQGVRVGILSGLRRLEMSKNGGFGSAGMEALMGAVSESEEGWPLLADLYLQKSRAGKGVAALGTALLSGKLGGLSRINLFRSDLDDDGVRRLAEAVREDTLFCVSSLDLSWNGNVGGEAWGEFMLSINESERGLPNLKTLDLQATHVLRAGAAIAPPLTSGKLPAQALRGLFPSHLFLTLYEGASIGGIAAAARGGALEHVTSLALGGGGNAGGKVLGEVLQAIAESEKGLPNLTLINFGGTNIMFAGAAIAAALAFGKIPRNLFTNLFPSHLICTADAAGLKGLAGAIRGGVLEKMASLDLFGCGNAGGDVFKELTRAIAESEKGLPNLSRIRLEGPDILGAGAAIVAAFASGKLPREVLTFLFPSDLVSDSDAAGFRGLAGALRGGWLENLTFLELRGDESVRKEVWEEVIDAIVESERGLPKLRRMNLDGPGILDAGAAVAVALGSGKLPSLEYVKPSHLLLDDEGVKRLGEGVRGGGFPSGLLSIDFRLRCSSGQMGVSAGPLLKALAESEAGLPSCMRVLSLKGGRLGEEALISLAESGGGVSGSKFSHLELLDLSKCEIDDPLLRKLGAVFRAHICSKLKRLDLGCNRITVEGLSVFFDTLTPATLRNLSHLHLKGQEGLVFEINRKQFESDVKDLVGRAKSEGKLPRLPVEHIQDNSNSRGNVHAVAT
uniref:Uncharacterized protein n=1 Tax=Chromera velia CCMP2878 TaxID=1169474 RepID=A0A0G4FT70_9ALVE|eukprot:Cvel_18625.t1-p1 / transcript=Cvel_18625.t1 / gene=Cvel_18625 / organism=Chromera_velia_CCMP2878 / gene_product=hypothetical protein / transcript_product=hypothetical protein / location=Cvel_scaffold1555:9279-11831(-) / protein_length=851 / sequence_SO=supercontig / SO=protein_coding / is_pseudo=false